MVTWTLLKLKTFSPEKKTLKWKHQPQTGKTVLVKDLFLEFIFYIF